MKYMLLIYDNEQAWGRLNEVEKTKIYGEYGQFSQEIRSSGHYLAGAQLHPTATATSVRVREGKQLVTDGPFAETHEQLGGYYLIEARDLDEANESRHGFHQRASVRSKSDRWLRCRRRRLRRAAA